MTILPCIMSHTHVCLLIASFDNDVTLKRKVKILLLLFDVIME